MSIQNINIGYLANDGTGDDLRDAFIKVNNNFDEMQLLLDNAIVVTGESVGLGKNIFKQKIGNILEFKTLIQGNNVLLTEHGDSVTITADSGLEQIIVLTEAGSIILPGGQQLLNIYGGTNIGTAVQVDGTDSYLKINVKGDGLLELDTDPHLGGDLIGNNKSIYDVHNVTANRFQGNLEGTVYGIDVRQINNALLEFDFGGIYQTVSNIIDYVYLTTDMDFGTITSPSGIVVDEGTF